MFHAEVGETIQLFVQFSPHVVAKMVADIRLSVVNNPFEDTTIQLFGEGYEEEVTIDNIQVLVEQDEVDVDEIFDEEAMIGMVLFRPPAHPPSINSRCIWELRVFMAS